MHPHNTYLRRGTIAVELVAAASLLVCMIGILAPLTVQTSRVWRSGRHTRLAVNELSNQLDVLTSLEAAELAEALKQLEPSEAVSLALPEAKLHGEIVRDADGTRLVLAIDWQRLVGAVPITMVGWVDAGAAESPDSAEPAQPVTDATDAKEAAL